MTAPESRADSGTVAEVVERVLLDEGAAPGSSIHSWRCEHPDRYGDCTCVAEIAQEIAAALTARDDTAGGGGALTDEERALIIDTGRHVYGCCADDCEYHGLPEDAQIKAVERILAARTAQPDGSTSAVEALVRADRIYVSMADLRAALAADKAHAAQEERDA